MTATPKQKRNRVLKQCAALFGSGAVGKSSICLRYLTGAFRKHYEPTLEDKYVKHTEIDGSPVELEILDTAGQEDLVSIRKNYINFYEGFIIVYSITSRQSFLEVNKFVQQILRVLNMEEGQEQNNTSAPAIDSQQCAYVPPLVLVGNKCDMEESRQVTYEEGNKLAEKYGMIFMETSAKTNLNTDKPFNAVSREILKKPKPSKKAWCIVQ